MQGGLLAHKLIHPLQVLKPTDSTTPMPIEISAWDRLRYKSNLSPGLLIAWVYCIIIFIFEHSFLLSLLNMCMETREEICLEDSFDNENSFCLQRA